ncbi:MAG: menaquinone biosynthesis protein [Chthonomonas sp.]|nr:menaquinone biosynthesis protein [Chthonomonas sp.]
MTRVGCVPYLNAYPLVARTTLDVHYAVPTELPPLLANREVAAILVSSIVGLRTPSARVVRGACVGSNGPVFSVRLFSKVPIVEIRSLALDQSSMTSNTLAQILLKELYRVSPEAQPEPPNLEEMLAKHDAAILIGDNGMRAQGSGLHVMDLGEAWTSWTGLPFVWAMWLGGPDLTTEIAAHLIHARQDALNNMEPIIDEAVERFGFSEEVTRSYLCNTMTYDFDARHEAALRVFGEFALAHGVIAEMCMPEWVEGGLAV